jgi:fluoroquinolone resistance protein
LIAPPAAGDTVEGRVFADLDWAEADFGDAVFVRCRFEGIQFTSVSLVGARFERCNLVGCRFAHADARETVFEDCVLRRPQDQTGVAIAFSRFEDASFTRCDLRFARMERSDLHGLSMEDCDLTGAVLSRCTFKRRLGRSESAARGRFVRCNLHLADLAGAGLAGCELSGSRLLEADLSGTDLAGADLRGSEFFGANLAGAKLARADLRDAEISGLDLTQLASREGMIIGPGQQHLLLAAMGIDVRLD